jgi:hypothetical protein
MTAPFARGRWSSARCYAAILPLVAALACNGELSGRSVRDAAPDPSAAPAQPLPSDRGAPRSLGLVDALVVSSGAADGPGTPRLFTVVERPEGFAIAARTRAPPPFVEDHEPASIWQLVDGDLFREGLARLVDAEGHTLILDVRHASRPRPLPPGAWASWLYAVTWLVSDGPAYDPLLPPTAFALRPWADVDSARARGDEAAARAALSAGLASRAFDPRDGRLLNEARAAESAGDLELALRILRGTAPALCDHRVDEVYGRVSLRAGHVGTYLQIRLRLIERFFYEEMRHCGGADPLRVRSDVAGLEAAGVDVDRLLAGLVLEPDTALAGPSPPAVRLRVLAGLIREMGRSEPVAAELLRRVADPDLDEWNRWRTLVVLYDLLEQPPAAAGEPFYRFPHRAFGACRRAIGDLALLPDWGVCAP